MLAVLSSITILTGMVGMTASANDETKEIIEAIKAFDKSFAEVLESTSTDSELESIGEENIYYSYEMNGFYPFIRGNYDNAENLESLISTDNFRIYVEVGNRLITILEKEGEFRAVGESFSLGNKSVLELKQIAKEKAAEIDEEIVDTKFCTLVIHRMSVIYYKTKDGNEFAVPYVKDWGDEKSALIESGKLYPADEFINQMKLYLYDENYNPYLYTGVPDTYIIGDANSDTYVDVRDCSFIARMLALNLKGRLREVCDYNKDGVINIRDAASIASFLTKR